eukprot:gene4927-3526_t
MPDLEVKVTEERLRSIFEKYGEIADVTVKKHMRTASDPVIQSGYAFLYFLGGESGVQAVQEMKSCTVDDIHYECSLSYKSEMAINAGSSSTATTPNVSASNTPTAATSRQMAAQNAAARSKPPTAPVTVSAASTPTGSSARVTVTIVTNAEQTATAPATPTASGLPGPSPTLAPVSAQAKVCVGDLPPPRSVTRASSGGKAGDSKGSGIPRPPPLVTQFPTQSRMTIPHNLRVNPSLQAPPTASSSTDTTPTSSPSFYMHGGSMPMAYQMGYLSSAGSSAASSPHGNVDAAYYHHRSMQAQSHGPMLHQRPSPMNSIPSPIMTYIPSPSAAPMAAYYAPYPSQVPGTPTAAGGQAVTGNMQMYHPPYVTATSGPGTPTGGGSYVSYVPVVPPPHANPGANNMTTQAPSPSHHMVYHNQQGSIPQLPSPVHVSQQPPQYANMMPQMQTAYMQHPGPSSMMPMQGTPYMSPPSPAYMVPPSPTAHHQQPHHQQQHHHQHHQQQQPLQQQHQQPQPSQQHQQAYYRTSTH